MSDQLWDCPECDRAVNGFVNGYTCPSCGHVRGSDGGQAAVGFSGP